MDVVRQARHALVSHLKVLLRARERLIQAEANPGYYPATTEPSSISNVDDDEPVPMVTGQDPDGEDPVHHRDVAVTIISGEEPANNDSVDSLHVHAHDAATAGSSVPNDDFYPLGDEPSDDDGPGDAIIQWYQQLYNPDDERMQLLRRLLLPATEDDGDALLNSELHGEESDEDRDDIRRAIAAGRLIVPHIDDVTPAVLMRDESRGGGVPASAAAIAGLKRQKYDGSGEDTSCVICMRDYKKGKGLLALPCPRRHRFHRKCLRKWLARSHVCPLCRHALPTVDDATD
jgi:hypothetical protein